MWTEYEEEFEKLPRQECGLFWVLDATLPPMPKKEKAKQTTLNPFSVRMSMKNMHASSLTCDNLHPSHYAKSMCLSSPYNICSGQVVWNSVMNIMYLFLNSPEWLGNSDMIEVRTQKIHNFQTKAAKTSGNCQPLG